jgi:NADH:ubiquinone oxidoreductase subunit C
VNQPTREEFNELKAEVQKLKEQRTDEMKAINVNVASADVLNELKALKQNQQEIFNALSQRIVDEGDEVVERVEALLIKYLKPSGNGH